MGVQEGIEKGRVQPLGGTHGGAWLGGSPGCLRGGGLGRGSWSFRAQGCPTAGPVGSGQLFNIFRKPPRKLVGQRLRPVRPTGLTFVSGPLSRESRLCVLQREEHRGARHTLGPPWGGLGGPTWRQGQPSPRRPQLGFQRGGPAPRPGRDLDCHEASREGEVKPAPLVGDARDTHSRDPHRTRGVEGQTSRGDPWGREGSVRRAGGSR